jgi:hypothetical protein
VLDLSRNAVSPSHAMDGTQTKNTEPAMPWMPLNMYKRKEEGVICTKFRIKWIYYHPFSVF